MPSPQDDLETVRQALAGDQPAMKELGVRLRCVPRQVHSLAKRYARSLRPEELADAAQDVFLKVWQSLGTYRGSASLEAWTWSVTRNHILSLMEAEDACRHRMLGDAAQELLELLETREERLWRHGDLQEALKDLPEDAERVIRMHHYDGLRLTEIAEREGVRLAALKTRYYRSLAVLREDLLRRSAPMRKGGVRS